MRLKIYWHKQTKNSIIIVEPSGKIHNSGPSDENGNMIDLQFMKKYIGQEVEFYNEDRNWQLPTITILEKVNIDENGIHGFVIDR